MKNCGNKAKAGNRKDEMKKHVKGKIKGGRVITEVEFISEGWMDTHNTQRVRDGEIEIYLYKDNDI